MNDDVYGPGMPRVELQCAPRHPFCATILAVLLEAESIHRKNACIAGHRGVPFRQDLSDAITQHAPQTQTEVQRVRNDERQNVAWKIDDDGSVTFDRESVIAVKPGARRGSVATRVIISIPANRFNRRYAFHELGSSASVVTTHDNGDAETVSEDEFRIVSKGPIYVTGRIAAICEESRQNLFKAGGQIIDAFCMQELCGLRSYRHDGSRCDSQAATHCRRRRIKAHIACALDEITMSVAADVE
jgi:hypothetical protein